MVENFCPWVRSRKSSAASEWFTSVFLVKGSADAKHQQWASTPAATVDAGQQFAHVGGRCTKAGAATEFVKNVLQVVAPGDDDAHRHGAQVEQQSKVVQVPVIERVFVVPFDFERDPVLEAVDLVGGAVLTMAVQQNFCLKLLFNPASRIQLAVDGGSDGRGVGFYFRNVTELILFGVRGKNARTLAPGRSQVNLLATQKREHSRKPDELYPLIESCSPGPFLEMFARGSRRGWSTWGNQADEYFPDWPTYSNHSQSTPEAAASQSGLFESANAF
jgi:hypothetical protein